jgi:phosphate transport system permease protein
MGAAHEQPPGLLRSRGRRGRPLEWAAEKAILATSLSALAFVGLILVFIGKEALPVFLGRTDTRLVGEVLPVEALDTIPPERLMEYLGLTSSQFKAMDHDTLKDLLQTKVDAAAEVPEEFRKDPDARVNTSGLGSMILPHQWTGYPKPEYIWQPVGRIQKFNLIPLFLGTLKTTIVGLLFAAPLALGAALFVSQLAPAWLREWAKPAIELLSGIPSVVIGVFALLTLASVLQGIFHYETRLNALVAGVALGFAVIPLVFSIAEDAFSSVPKTYVQAALAVGASRWRAAKDIVFPAALPGVFASLVLGFGRAVGETMIVLMVCSAPVVSWSVVDSARSVTTTIAAEMGEVVAGSPHYRILFALGAILFLLTLATNLVADHFINGLKRKLEGRK